MKRFEIQFKCYLNQIVTYTVKAKNYEDAVRKFTDKYGTWIGTRKELMGHYTISEING